MARPDTEHPVMDFDDILIILALSIFAISAFLGLFAAAAVEDSKTKAAPQRPAIVQTVEPSRLCQCAAKE